MIQKINLKYYQIKFLTELEFKKLNIYFSIYVANS